MSEQDSTDSEIRVLLVGLGAIGCEIAKLLLKKRNVKIVGAVDLDPSKVGKDLGNVIGLKEPLGVTVLESIKDFDAEAEIAVHATTSFLDKAYPQILELIKRGLNVISTCEELSYPYVVDEEISRRIDETAREHNVTVLGTGINPGFLMDTLVITLTSVCQDIKRICVERVIDAAKRRLPFQRKIGAGLDIRDFKEKIVKGEITGHVGLKQSIAMIADAVGWRIDRIIEEPVEPIIAEKEVKTNYVVVKPKMVAGLSQKAHGIAKNEKVISLIFKAYVGAVEEYDSITIEGIPMIRERISPCIHGDAGTVAIIVNLIPKVINAPSGLKTMKDLQVPSAVLDDMQFHLKSKKI